MSGELFVINSGGNDDADGKEIYDRIYEAARFGCNLDGVSTRTTSNVEPLQRTNLSNVYIVSDKFFVVPLVDVDEVLAAIPSITLKVGDVISIEQLIPFSVCSMFQNGIKTTSGYKATV